MGILIYVPDGGNAGHYEIFYPSSGTPNTSCVMACGEDLRFFR